MHITLNHYVVHLKLIKHYTSTTRQQKIILYCTFDSCWEQILNFSSRTRNAWSTTGERKLEVDKTFSKDVGPYVDLDETESSTWPLMNSAANEKAAHADFLKDFVHLFDDDDIYWDTVVNLVKPLLCSGLVDLLKRQFQTDLKTLWTLPEIRRWLTQKEKNSFNYLYEAYESLNETKFHPLFKKRKKKSHHKEKTVIRVVLNVN